MFAVHNNNAKCSTICFYCVFHTYIYTMADVVGFEYNITSHHNQDNYLADPEACHVQ